MRLLLLVLCLSYPAAADVAPAQPPYLGVGVEEVTEFDAARGLSVTTIAPGATFDRLGIKEGDRLVSVNGTTITSTDSFRAVAKTLTNGMAMTVVVIRNGANLTVTGTLVATPRPREIAEEGDRLRQEASDLRALADQVATKASTKNSLEEALRLIKQVEEALPKAAEDFKRVYPNGTFRISINIDIRSDQGAKDPEKLVPAPDAPPAAKP